MDLRNFTIETDADGFATVRWDMPGRSMNVFTEEVMNEIDRMADAFSSDASVKGVVFTSGKSGSFTGGADLKMLRGMFDAYEAKLSADREAAVKELFERCGEMGRIWRKIETGGKPWVAAINGTCMGGGFELALACQTIVAEEGVQMGLPEVLFNLFPGMGAYSFLCKRIAPHQAEKLMLDGNVYPAEQLYRMGLVDVLAPRGEGVRAVEEVIRNNRRIPHARAAMHRVRAMHQPVTVEELMTITEVWVDTALRLGEKSLRTMERLVRAQYRRHGDNDVATA